MKALRLTALAGAALLSAAAFAAPPLLAPYRPLYPGQYLEASVEHDEGNRSFDADGQRRRVLPNSAAGGRLASERLEARWAWYFPLFEQDHLPWWSDRLLTVRLTLRYADLQPSAAFQPLVDTAPGRHNARGGVGDTTLEFGSFLSGSGGWREGRVERLSSLLLVGLTLPTGDYDHDAIANAGDNQVAAYIRLGAHGEPWPGTLLDLGLGLRTYGRNAEPQFGANAPAHRGDEGLWDVQLAQRLRPGLYAGLALDGRSGSPNRYRNPELLAPQPGLPVLSDAIAAPGIYRDQGSSQVNAALSLRWFFNRRIAAALHYTHPLSGESGEFDVDRLSRTPAGCNLASPLCLTTPLAPVRADGLGPARSLASDRLALSLSWQFGLGERYPCTGCAD